MAIKPSMLHDDCIATGILGSEYDIVRYVAEHIEQIKEVANISYFFYNYLGAHTEPPTVRPDDTPLKVGDFYLDLNTNAFSYVSSIDPVKWMQVNPVEILKMLEEVRDIHTKVNMTAHKIAVIQLAVAALEERAKNSADIALEAKITTQRLRDETEVLKDQTVSIKVEAEGFATKAEAAKDAAVAAQTAAETAKDSAELAAEESRKIYEAFQKGLAYGGPYNIQAANAYPTAPEINTTWDIILNSGTTNHEFDNINWQAGDRLIYVVAENKFYHVELTLGGVVTVNGKSGSVVLTAEDVQALPISGGTLTGIAECPVMATQDNHLVNKAYVDTAIEANNKSNVMTVTDMTHEGISTQVDFDTLTKAGMYIFSHVRNPLNHPMQFDSATASTVSLEVISAVYEGTKTLNTVQTLKWYAAPDKTVATAVRTSVNGSFSGIIWSFTQAPKPTFGDASYSAVNKFNPDAILRTSTHSINGFKADITKIPQEVQDLVSSGKYSLQTIILDVNSSTDAENITTVGKAGTQNLDAILHAESEEYPNIAVKYLRHWESGTGVVKFTGWATLAGAEQGAGEYLPITGGNMSGIIGLPILKDAINCPNLTSTEKGVISTAPTAITVGNIQTDLILAGSDRLTAHIGNNVGKVYTTLDKPTPGELDVYTKEEIDEMMANARGVPVGTIVMFAHESDIPDGFINLCVDNPTFSTTLYPNLAKLYPDGTLPSYKDRYPRGIGIHKPGFRSMWQIPEHYHTVMLDAEGTTGSHTHTHAGTTSTDGNHVHSQNTTLVVGGGSVSDGPGYSISKGNTPAAGSHSHTLTTDSNTHSHPFTARIFGQTKGVSNLLQVGNRVEVDAVGTVFAIKASGELEEIGASELQGLKDSIIANTNKIDGLTADDVGALPLVEVVSSASSGFAGISNKVPRVGSNGVLAIGKYIDMYDTNTTSGAYSVRLQCSPSSFDVDGFLLEKAQRVYSPNNKPTPAGIGAIPSKNIKMIPIGGDVAITEPSGIYSQARNGDVQSLLHLFQGNTGAYSSPSMDLAWETASQRLLFRSSTHDRQGSWVNVYTSQFKPTPAEIGASETLSYGVTVSASNTSPVLFKGKPLTSYGTLSCFRVTAFTTGTSAKPTASEVLFYHSNPIWSLDKIIEGPHSNSIRFTIKDGVLHVGLISHSQNYAIIVIVTKLY